MLKLRHLLVIISCLICMEGAFFEAAVRADDVYTFVVKKQQEKPKYSAWLSDWLETRDHMRLMDMWLALHSPSPYEFFVGGGYVNVTSIPGGTTAGTEFHVGAFNRIFGLELHRDSSVETRYTGIFDLRFFGFYDQSTNITAQIGIRDVDLGLARTRNPLLGLKMDIYIARALGIHGLYRHFYESTPNASGLTLTGERWEAGGFLEFAILRVYANYIAEPESQLNSPGSKDVSRTGFEAGARIYF